MQHSHLGADHKDLEFLKKFKKECVREGPFYMGKHVFQPGHQPPTVRGRDATHMRDEDCVIGVHLNGQSRAYPYWIADKYHTINDTLGDEKVLITC